MDLKRPTIVNGEAFFVDRQEFKLVTDPNASFKEYGWTEEFVKDMLYIAENEPDHEWMSDHEILNNLGIVYSDGVGVERNIEKSIMYFERAVELDDELARSNLADIYRKGWLYGISVDHQKAFELYKDCHLPYAYYRVGEYYENGRAGVVDIEQAKKYYRVAYEAGHGLARKKLQTFDFLH